MCVCVCVYVCVCVCETLNLNVWENTAFWMEDPWDLKG